MLILLDQFTRNIFRGSPDAFKSDTKAQDIAVRGIAKGYDKAVLPLQQAFFYLPLMHSEQLLAQTAGVAAYEGLLQRCDQEQEARLFAEASLRSAIEHRDVISRFGRFPSRNIILGRVSTSAETEFLIQHPGGF